MAKNLRFFKCVDRDDPVVVHHAFRNQFQHAWVYTPICEGMRLLYAFNLPKTRREDGHAVVTCIQCFQHKAEYDVSARAYKKKVLAR